MSSSDLARKAVSQGGRPLRRQATGMAIPTAPIGSRPKRTAASRKLHKERSMRIPAIENDMMNRIGITKKKKAMVRAASPKATRSSTRSSPYKNLLVGIARNKDGSIVASNAEGSASTSSVNIVRCASPELLPSSSSTPQPPKQPATATGAAEAKGKKKSNTPQSFIVLRPLPSRVAASSSRIAGSPLSRTPPDAPTAPEMRLRTTRSSGASPFRPDSYLPRNRSPLARSDDAPVTEKISPPPAPMADKSTGQPKKVQGKGAPCVSSSEEGDSQSDDHSSSDATSDAGSCVPDTSAADVAQAAAIKQSLLSQIEERNEGKKWDDLLGFFHGLAPSEVGGLLKTATRAGRRALRRLAGKETVESGPSNMENDVRVLGRAREPRRRDESVLRFDNAGSDGEATNRTIVPPRQRQFLYKAKGKARAKSPSPLLPSSPSPVFDSQTGGASTSSPCTSNGLSAPMAPKRSRTPEEDDEPTTKRRKPRPLVREGAFYEYPTPAQPKNDSDAEPQPVHMNLFESFLDHVQDLDVSRWLPRGGRAGAGAGDPFSAHEDEDDEFWTLGAARRIQRRRRADDGLEEDDARTCSALGGMSSSHLSWS